MEWHRSQIVDQNQQTIKNDILISGIGLHSGKQVEMKLVPAEVDQGVKFIRSDKTNNNVINAKVRRMANNT